MSTKIYDAYVYSGSLESLMRRFTAYRREAIEVYAAYAAEQLREAGIVRGSEITVAVKSVLTSRMMVEAVKSPSGRHVELVTPKCGAAVYFLRGKTLVQFFGVPHDLPTGTAPKFELPKRYFRDFHYQNSTDRPRGVSAREWSERKRVWGRVFKDALTPAEAGLTFEFIGQDDDLRLTAAVERKLHGHTGRWFHADCAVCVLTRQQLLKENNQPQGEGHE